MVALVLAEIAGSKVLYITDSMYTNSMRTEKMQFLISYFYILPIAAKDLILLVRVNSRFMLQPKLGLRARRIDY